MKTRNEIIAEANEMGLTFERPVNQVKSSIIEEAIAAAKAKMTSEPEVEFKPENETETEVEFKPETETETELEEYPDEVFQSMGKTEAAKPEKVTIYSQILALAKLQTMSRTEIYNALKVEHPKLNYRYVVQTLLKAKIDVPRQQRDPNSFRKGSAKTNINELEAKIAELEAKLHSMVPVTEEAGE